MKWHRYTDFGDMSAVSVCVRSVGGVGRGEEGQGISWVLSLGSILVPLTGRLQKAGVKRGPGRGDAPMALPSGTQRAGSSRLCPSLSEGGQHCLGSGASPRTSYLLSHCVCQVFLNKCLTGEMRAQR